MTSRNAVRKLRALVQRIQREKLHQPDSDSMEYCAGCRRSPYNKPPHDPTCLVVEIEKTLAATETVTHPTS